MALPMKPCPPHPKLDELIKRAAAVLDAMTPEQRREHWAAQRRSWVIGELMLQHEEMTREEAEAIVRRAEQQ